MNHQAVVSLVEVVQNLENRLTRIERTVRPRQRLSKRGNFNKVGTVITAARQFVKAKGRRHFTADELKSYMRRLNLNRRFASMYQFNKAVSNALRLYAQPVFIGGETLWALSSAGRNIKFKGVLV